MVAVWPLLRPIDGTLVGESSDPSAGGYCRVMGTHCLAVSHHLASTGHGSGRGRGVPEGKEISGWKWLYSIDTTYLALFTRVQLVL